MTEIHLLEQLAAFADCGTLSAAAEKLHECQISPASRTGILLGTCHELILSRIRIQLPYTARADAAWTD